MPYEKNYGSWSIDNKTIYDYAEPFNEGLAFIEKDYKQSFIDKEGRVVIRHSSKRDLETQCQCGRILFASKNGVGFLNNKGKVIISPTHLHAEGFFNGRCIVANDDQKYGVIGLDGKTVVKPTYDFIDNFSCGLAYFSKNGKIGFMDINGGTVIEPTFTNATAFKDGTAKVLREGRKYHSIIDIYNKELFSIRRFQTIEPFSESLAAVKIKELWGFVDTTGEIVIPPIYNKTLGFSGGLAAVQYDNNRWGFIDGRGKVAITPSFSEARSFREGLAAVRRMNEWGFIDKAGKFIVDPKFMEISDVSEDTAVITSYRGVRFIKFM